MLHHVASFDVEFVFSGGTSTLIATYFGFAAEKVVIISIEKKISSTSIYDTAIRLVANSLTFVLEWTDLGQFSTNLNLTIKHTYYPAILHNNKTKQT